MKKVYQALIMIAALIGAVFSLILIIHHLNPTANVPFCGTDPNSGCGQLNRSNISELFGFPIALYGFLFYSALMFLSYVHQNKSKVEYLKWIFVLTLVALACDIGLLIYSLVTVKTVCILCFITYMSSLVIFIATIKLLQDEKLSQSWFKLSFKELLSETMPAGITFTLAGSSALLIGLLITYGSFSKNPYVSLGESQSKFLKYFNQATALKLDHSKAASKGVAMAAVTIVKFADFQCMHCKSAAKELDSYLEYFNPMLKVYYRHYPLDGACNPDIQKDRQTGSCLLAYAAVCAQKQHKFWPMHDKIFANQSLLTQTGVTEELVKDYAKDIKLDNYRFSQCLVSKETTNQVLDDIKVAQKFGISGTPLIILNDKKQDGLPPRIFLGPIIEQVINQKTKRNHGQSSISPK